MTDFSFPQQGDLDNAPNFAFGLGFNNLADFVVAGLEIRNVDWDAGTFDTTTGKFAVLLDEQYAPTENEYRSLCLLVSEIDPRSGTDPDSGTQFDTSVTNYVYVRVDEGRQDAPSIEVTQEETEFDDGVHIATIDPSFADPDDRIDRHNEAPTGEYEVLTVFDHLYVNGPITYSDGQTRSEAPATVSSILEAIFEDYNHEANDPEEVVRRSYYATEADSADYATEAGNSETSDYADESGQVGDLTAGDILTRIGRAGGEWTKITTNPLVDANKNNPLSLDFDIRNYPGHSPYDRYKVEIYSENHGGPNLGLYLTLNNHTGANYNILELDPRENRDPIERVSGARHFDIGEALDHSMGVHDVHLALPTPVVKPKYHYPVYGSGPHLTGPIAGYELCGNLSVPIGQIRSIQLRGNKDSTGRVVVKGKNIS